MKTDGTALRKNDGKLRVDLIPDRALMEVAKVFTFGAEKYDDNNWRKGMPWSKCIASLERHLKAFKNRKDFDDESGLLHLAHLVTNGLFLLEYYNIYPQGDDRVRMPDFRIALDVDDVVADFVGGFMKKTKSKEPRSWAWSRAFREFMQQGGANEEFYLGLQKKETGYFWGFEPVCYITDRPVSSSVTEKWLEDNDLPYAEVVTTKDKVEACLEKNINVFVDDKYETYLRMNKAGVTCFLMNTPHNRTYDVGWYRIYSLDDIKLKLGFDY